MSRKNTKDRLAESKTAEQDAPVQPLWKTRLADENSTTNPQSEVSMFDGSTAATEQKTSEATSASVASPTKSETSVPAVDSNAASPATDVEERIKAFQAKHQSEAASVATTILSPKSMNDIIKQLTTTPSGKHRAGSKGLITSIYVNGAAHELLELGIIDQDQYDRWHRDYNL
ncbi:hypothetical protein ACRYI5_10855 [Furfurilactobacillus sp. WILCCON 0119]